MVRKLTVTLGLCAALWAAVPAVAGATSISGTVTAAATQAPLAEVVVCAESVGVTDIFGCGETGSNGVYVVADLEGGNYKVEFSPSIVSGYLPQYYSGKTGSEQADLVAVVDGLDTAGIDAALAAETPSGGAPPIDVPAVALPLPSVSQVVLPFALPNKPKSILRCRKGWRKVKVKGRLHCRKIAHPQRPGGAKRAS